MKYISYINTKLVFSLFLIAMVLQSCSSAKDYNNDLLLFNSHKSGKKAIEKIKSAINSENDDFILYELSYLIIGTPTYLPKGITQYLLIPKKKFGANDTTDYFELFRYSNYSSVIKMADISGQEYTLLMKYIENVKYYTELDCDRGNENSLNLAFHFYLNLNGFQETASTLDLWEENTKVRSQYLCLQSYLNTLLFTRELDYYGNRIFNDE